MKKNGLKIPVKELKVRYWYEGVRLRTGETSAYGLEKRFEPKKTNQDGEKLAPPKKWPRYKKGKVVPCPDLGATVEKVAPGSLKELNSPLWEVLLIENMTIRRVARYVDLLEPKVRTAMHKWRHAEVAGMQNHVRYNQGRTLVRAGSLDALAALVLMWDVYRHEARDEDMRILADLIYECMLIAGEEFRARGLVAEFFEVFYAKIFGRTTWENGKCILNAKVFAQGVEMLNHTLSTVVDEGPLRSQDDICRVKQRLIYGKKGLDCLFGFSIPIFPDWKAGPPTRSQHKDGMLKLVQWLWGWTHLENQTIGRFPNDDFWEMLRVNIGVCELR